MIIEIHNKTEFPHVEIHSALSVGNKVKIGNDIYELSDFMFDAQIEEGHIVRMLGGDSLALQADIDEQLEAYAEKLALKAIHVTQPKDDY